MGALGGSKLLGGGLLGAHVVELLLVASISESPSRQKNGAAAAHAVQLTLAPTLARIEEKLDGPVTPQFLCSEKRGNPALRLACLG